MRSQGTEFIGERGYVQASEEEGGERRGLFLNFKGHAPSPFLQGQPLQTAASTCR